MRAKTKRKLEQRRDDVNMELTIRQPERYWESTVLPLLGRAVHFSYRTEVGWPDSIYAIHKHGASEALASLHAQPGQRRKLRLFDWLLLREELARYVTWGKLEEQDERLGVALFVELKGGTERNLAAISVITRAQEHGRALKAVESARKRLEKAERDLLDRARLELTKTNPAEAKRIDADDAVRYFGGKPDEGREKLRSQLDVERRLNRKHGP